MNIKDMYQKVGNLNEEIQNQEDGGKDTNIHNWLYKMAFEKSPDAMLMLEDHRIIDCNESAVRYFGYDTKRELLKYMPYELSPVIQPDGKPSMVKALEMIIQAEKNGNHRFEWVHKNKMGQSIFTEVVLTLFPIENRSVMSASLRDITENNKARLALVASEQKYKQLFHNANDMIFLHATNGDKGPGKIIEANDIACMKLGYSREELLKMTPRELNTENMKKFVSRNTEKLLKERYATFETVLEAKEGDKISVEINAHVFNMQGKDVVLSVVRDITERKETMKLLGETIAYDKLKTEFFANISHELRTPLNVMFGTLQLLELYLQKGNETMNTRDIERHVKRMKQNGYRLLRLVNNLIDITKIDSGYYEVNLQSDDIVRLVENITLSVAEYVESKGISLEFDTDIEEKVLACDPDTLERVMLNLLANAMKFTNPGGMIKVNVHDKAEHIVITVSDTGIGIPKEKLNSIFERFRQVDKSLTRSHEGSGIGLSLVRSLVELHGGTITVESVVGKGSSFIITLPVKSVKDKTQEDHPIGTEKQSKIERIHVEFSDIYSINI
ncbi:MAG: domain S-box protein [Anaerosolibacter sp.]|nr:domain S-box protein [Anaerosolibacter sp.]